MDNFKESNKTAIILLIIFPVNMMMAEPLLPCRSYNAAKPNGRESGSISSTVPRGLSPCGKSVRNRTARGNGASTVLLAPAEGWL